MQKNHSLKPYLLRALYDWCADQGHTPYLSVIVDEHTRVPEPYVKDGQITLDINHDAVYKFHMDNEWVTFRARFGGVPYDIAIPIGAVQAFYAQENGVGMAFEVFDSVAKTLKKNIEQNLADDSQKEDIAKSSQQTKRPVLTRIK